MKVKNITNSKGRPVVNQFILSESGNGANGNYILKEVFQSYSSVIAERITWIDSIDITLDKNYWDYSTTTGKYRNLFLGETKKETKEKIEKGVYKLSDLNK